MSPPAGVVDGLLAGRYRLVSRIGSGGNGEVWRARDERLGRDVAVKVLRPELADDEDVRARFRAEARHAGRLRSPGIAAVFDFAEDDDGAWLVMELVDGLPLSEVLRREGRLPVDRTLDLLGQTAAALQVAHDGGVVHRDVKPGNLLVRSDGRLSVTDFGIAHAAGAAALTRTGQVVGTASYLSPEQASGAPVTPATDLYALGVVAYECLSGRRPFERDDPVAVLLAHLQTPPPPLPDDVPPAVAALVHRLLAKDPADRPATAAQVQRDAARLRRGLTAAPAPTAVLPVPPADVTTAAATAAPAAAAPAARSTARGLAGRPGQRRAVRATAVALGLLAVALGVRDATTDDPADPADVRQPRPATTAPPAPAASAEAPVVQPQDGPEQQPAPARDEAEPGPQEAEDAQQQRERTEEQPEQTEERQEQTEERQDERQEKEQERLRKQQEKVQERDEKGGGG